jgi:hypothetical protein
MHFHAYRTLVLALALPLLGVGLGSGCARQGEGEPCDFAGGSDDCESGLTCTSPDSVIGEGTADEPGRCCPVSGNVRDGRCTPSGGGGAGGTGGTSGEDGGGDAPGGAGGTGGVGCDLPCSFNSDCADNLVCGPQGCCQAECQEDRDCVSPEVCVSGTCETAVPEAGPEPEPEPEAGTD